MKKSFVLVFAVLIVLAFICPALSADNPVDKSKQAPAKTDIKGNVQSKEIKGKTEKNTTSKKTDKALGYGGSPIPPGPGPAPGPGGKSTNTVK